MENDSQGDKDVVVPPAAIEAEASAPSQEKDPVQAELDRIDAKPKRTRLETLTYNAERLQRELAEERRKNGITDDDSQPLTRADLKAFQQEQAQETALSFADKEIENENERKLVKYHLENTIKPSGDAETDFKNARIIVNSVKNNMIAQETLRSVQPKKAGSAASAPPKETAQTDLTKEERDYMIAFKLTPQQVLDARPKE